MEKRRRSRGKCWQDKKSPKFTREQSGWVSTWWSNVPELRVDGVGCDPTLPEGGDATYSPPEIEFIHFVAGNNCCPAIYCLIDKLQKEAITWKLHWMIMHRLNNSFAFIIESSHVLLLEFWKLQCQSAKWLTLAQWKTLGHCHSLSCALAQLLKKNISCYKIRNEITNLQPIKI